MLNAVKTLLGITGTYQDALLQGYIDEVVSFLTESGISSSDITNGLVARGVADLWNYGSGDGKFSQYFFERATQLRYKNVQS